MVPADPVEWTRRNTRPGRRAHDWTRIRAHLARSTTIRSVATTGEMRGMTSRAGHVRVQTNPRHERKRGGFARRTRPGRKNVLRAADGESTVDVEDRKEEGTVEAPKAELAAPKTKSVVVLGGSGFVGSGVCRALLAKGAKVVSVNRSGPPPSDGGAWANRVTWIRGDVFDEDSWIDCLEGVDAVVSCIGGFGTVADMERVCGDATVNSVSTAKKKSVPKFVFVSVYDYNIPDEIKKRTGYFSGKKRAEEAVLREFPEQGVVVRPGFIYGDKRVGDVVLPLGNVGKPLEGVLKNLPEGLTDVLKKLPASDLALAPPVSVDVVAKAIANAIYDPEVSGVLELKEIERLSEATS